MSQTRPGQLGARTGRLLRAAMHVFGVIALVGLSGMTVQALAEQSERRRFRPPGQLVDIGGGQQIHLRLWGETNAGPTVVLDISAAMVSSVWSWLAADLAERGYRVVAYDRPGMAWSHGPWQPRDARHAADALRAALDVAAIPGPYVVVAHSYGAYSSRVFTGLNRDRVTALALLDSTHPEGGGGRGYGILYRLQALVGHSGFFQLVRPPNTFTSLPPGEVDAAYAVTRWTTHLDTTAEELEAWTTSAEQVMAFPHFGDLPLLIVSAAGSEHHLQQQRDLLNLSDASRFVQVDAEHMGMLLNQAPAEQIAAAVDQLVSMSN